MTLPEQTSSRWSEPYSPLAWELALQAELTATDGGGVEAVVALSSDEISAVGSTSSAAAQNLALALDEWARSRS